MVFTVHITKTGKKDLENISKYLYENGDINLDFIEKILNFIETLGNFPKKYIKKSNYYICHFGKYNIFYIINETKEQVKVFKIVNSAQFTKYEKYFTKI